MKRIVSRNERRWRRPLHGSKHGKRSWLSSMLLLVMLSIVPQGAWAILGSDIDGTGFFWKYFIRNVQYHDDNNGNNPYITFSLAVAFDYGSYHEGYYSSGITLYASRNGKTDDASMETLAKITVSASSTVTVHLSEQCDGFGTDDAKPTPYLYDESAAGAGQTWHQDFKWKLPLQWRNCNIKFKGNGIWCYKDGKSPHTINNISAQQFREKASTYKFAVRNLQWNVDYSITPDGTVTIPYKFGTACNTDGDTRIWTMINNSWCNQISAVEVGKNNNYNAGSYSFKLSDITINNKKLDFRTTFTVQPYHEFKHIHDKDASQNGVKYYTSAIAAEAKTVHQLPIATNLNVSFDQDENKVMLTWKADNTNYAEGNHGTKWAIYRDGAYLASVDQDVTSDNYNSITGQYVFIDESFPHKEGLTYEIYYIWKGWDEKTARVDELKSEEKSVTTTLTLPINDLTATQAADRIVFTWTSDSHKASWGHEFRIYVDDETTPIYTIKPTDNQTNYCWIHRTTDKHTNRVNGYEDDIPYTEEPLNACEPHDYRVESYARGELISKKTLTGRAIGNGTLFYSADATKGAYAGIVKLNWHVNLQGSTQAKTYVIERRTAEHEDEPWESINPGISSREEYLSFTDDTPLPGVYYDYRVTVIDRCEDGTQVTNNITVVGFAQTTGTVSGRITFGSAGTAVAGVDVLAKKTSSGGNDLDQFHAMRFTGTNGAVSWTYPESTYASGKFSASNFSMQMWINPEEFDNTWFARFCDNCALGMNDTGKLLFCDGTDNYVFDLTLKQNVYNHVVLTRSGATLVCCLMDYDDDGNPVARKDTQELTRDLPLNDATKFELGYFKGYVDDFRLWTKCLTENEILENYDHLLVGNEKGLETYWTFDEGLHRQFFDSSRAGTAYHNHHGKMGSNTEPSTYTPDALALKAKTDIDGNYIIQGVPFSGEGTTYAIIPTLGIHEFNPTQQLRFVSNNSLVHNGTDFTDVSSFPVSGKIYYSGTDYPVEGVNFYIDGIVCSKNGELVTTNNNGEYTISVPIGKHFIEVKKNGHVFVNNGRYPADPNNTGTMHNFDRPLNIEFRDTTLVNFTGRIAGGDIEGKKPVGFPMITNSTNNIGITEMVLTPLNEVPRMNVVRVVNGTIIQDLTNQTTVPIASATDSINSQSWRGAGDDSEAKKLYIRTDPKSGEFSAMLPPLEYNVASMKLVYDESHKDVGEPFVIDLTNPLVENSDTVYKNDGTYELYTYNTILRQVYHSEPQFIVTQNEDGSFGMKTYEINDKLTIDDIYKIENGKPVYKYGQDENGVGVPLFEMNQPYIFHLKAYEEYINNDDSEPVKTVVPLSGLVVTIDNALSNQQPVYIESGTVNGVDVAAGDLAELQSNQLKLDSLGNYDYEWTAGLPNISAPYTRTISMTYDINGVSYQWSQSGMKGIVLGALPTGNNFVTAGTDQLDMILRDPPGTGSSAEWTTGTVTTETTSHYGTWSAEVGLNTVTKLGVSTTIITGTVCLGSINNLESKYDLEVGVKTTTEGENGFTWSRTVETTKAISTSSQPDYVGDQGDIFIGSSTNIIFGKARKLGFQRIGNTDSFTLDVEDAITTGLKFDTEFSYTQKYIENTLIPNLYALRNSLLTPSTSFDGHIADGRPVYLTAIPPDDPRFGLPNDDKIWGDAAVMGPIGPSYTTFFPDPNNNYQDSVQWYNNQIETWKRHLAFNEKEKARAYDLRENQDSVEYVNYSFDAGASVTVTTDSTEANSSKYDAKIAMSFHLGNSWGVNINNTGVVWQLSVDGGGGYHKEHEQSTENKASFSYTLAEEGSDALTVDVYRYGAFGPIFRTRGGQTSNPYEGEVRAKYYTDSLGNHPVIMNATMQIEVPTIDVDVPIVSDIPTGSAANYTVRLGNQSEIGEDVAYRLFMLDETNPDGAELTMDGKVITTGRLIKVPANQTLTKSLQLRQTNTSVLDYEGATNPNHELYGRGIGIVFASDSQPEDIADTIFIKAHFVPSSSPVTLELSNTIINTTLGASPNLVLTFKDFDRNYHNLKAFRLQYKKQGSTDWTLLKEYVLNDADKTENNLLLPATGASVSYSKPMSSFTDGNYLFRCVSVATYGTGEVCRYSDEIALVKDMQKPRPIGQPEPADGILDIGDNISIVFNENVIKGEITKSANFLVTGVLNGAEIAHETALRLSGGSAASGASVLPTAQTEASINLADKDFSIDTWVNVNGPGTLLSHGQGTNKLTIGTNADGKLVVTIASNTYTSSNSVPTGEWAFLSMNVTADGKLNATVATANETKKLFTNEPVATYSGNGPLTVGGGAAVAGGVGGDLQSPAAIHELLLWDEAHDIATALANRSKSKNPSTRHLIGYWKMDEGEGKTIRDYARSRNMVMPNETWYLNNENKAVSLDGEHYLSINTTMLPVTEYDDYALEFWMRGDQQAGEAQLLQVGDISLSLTADGQLQLTGKNAANPAAATPIATTTGNMADNAWHHVALNVLRQGAAAVYVDGKRCLTTNVANVGGINGDRLVLGVRRTYDATVGGTDNYTYDNSFKGEIDEVRVWGATLNGDQLAKNRKMRFTGSEAGLIAYYPFETKGVNDYGQVVTQETAADLTNSGLQAQLTVLGGSPTEMTYTDNAPALHTKPTETNVSFSFVASDEKIVIEIDEDPATIEGCTLNFSVRSVRDLNGNYSEPAVWSAFVNRKDLVWKESSVGCNCVATTGTTLTATIVNKGGKQQMWTLSGMPSWLQASTEYGTTNPLEETTVTFTVSPATPIGKYEETVYLKDNNGIETPLTVNVRVTGNEPMWTANSADFNGSMNIIANLDILGAMSEDEDDIVAAFIKGQCRGVAKPEYNKDYDGFFVTMTIYGNSDDDEQEEVVEFKAYDASTGIIYPVVKSIRYEETTPADIIFKDNELIGRYGKPARLSATDEIEQNIDLAKGWNWLSLGVKPDVSTPNTVFSKAGGKAAFVKYGDYSAEFVDDEWVGTLTDMNNRVMYAVQTNDAFTLSVTGHRVKSNEEPISVKVGWTWVAFNSMLVMSLEEALIDMDPKDDEIIKSQHTVAYYDNHKWVGSLKQMTPGLGYKLMGKQARTFTYPTKTATGAAARLAAEGFSSPGPSSPSGLSSPRASAFTPVDYRSYPANMVLIAQTVSDGFAVGNVEVGVFAGEECREAAVSDEDGMIYITIPGDEPCELNFCAAIGNSEFVISNLVLRYETDAVIGTPRAPFIINLGEATGISDMVNSEKPATAIYDLQGRKLTPHSSLLTPNSSLRKGVYIINGQKTVK